MVHIFIYVRFQTSI